MGGWSRRKLLASLALATYLPHTTAFGAVSASWLAATVVATIQPEDALRAFDGVAQFAFAAVIAAGALVLTRRREELGR